MNEKISYSIVIITGIILLLISICLIIYKLNSIIISLKINLLKKNGFAYLQMGQAWRWRRGEEVISGKEINKLTYKELKRKITS